MKALVIGSGRMGRAIAYDLLKVNEVQGVTLADRDQAVIGTAITWLGEQLPRHVNKLTTTPVDAADESAVQRLARGHNVVISASDYSLNERLARAAIAARASFVDLGGNNSVVDAELALDGLAKEAGVTVVPDCGLAAGMVA